jgi:arsenite-transporting ATPase
VQEDKYDFYIFDMPPFGHGVRMISMARILDTWIDKLDDTRKKASEYDGVVTALKGSTEAESQDAIIEELTGIRKKLDFFSALLSDPKRTAFFMVLIPEKMAILDTKRALEMFEKLDLRLSGIIVNQVYPPELLQRSDVGQFLRNRIEMQQGYMKEIAKDFGKDVRAVCPMFDREPKGLDMIARVADSIFEKPFMGKASIEELTR